MKSTPASVSGTRHVTIVDPSKNSNIFISSSGSSVNETLSCSRSGSDEADYSKSDENNISTNKKKKLIYNSKNNVNKKFKIFAETQARRRVRTFSGSKSEDHFMTTENGRVSFFVKF